LIFTARIKRLGRFAAWAAAYALVFNVMLTSALLATVSPAKFNALHELCLNGGSLPSTDGSTDKAKPVIRCPLCTSAMAAIDAPPQSPALAIRIALHAEFEQARLETIAPRLVSTDHQPRGPPYQT